MAEIGRREGRNAFRRLIRDAVPAKHMTRVDQLLNSVVFGAEPILRELEHFEVRYGTAAPTSGDYPEDGFGLFIDETADDVYACLQWRGEFYVVGGSTGVTGEINTASNLGAGVGVYEQKAGVDLQFNSLVSANAYLTITEDDPNNEIDFTIDESAFDATYLRRDGTTELTGEWGLGDTYGLSEVPYIDFYLSYAGAHQEGRLHWNDDDGTLNIGLPGGSVELQVGQEMLVRCRNTTGAQIPNGSTVYITGSSGNKPLINLSKADAKATAIVFGVTTEDIDHNTNGYVNVGGLVRDMDTSAFSAGDYMFLSDSVAGGYATTPPAPPSYKARVGYCLDSHASSGVMLVDVAVVPLLQSLSDVEAGPADGDFPVYNLAATVFEYDNVGNYLPRDEWLQNGFPDKSEVDMDWDDGSRTLTIQPVSGSFRYYYEGILYTEAGSITETIPDTEGLWVIYIDGEGTMAQALNPSHADVDDVIDNECIVAYVYWDAANNDGRLMSELHGSRMSPATHHYLHDNLGAQYFDGLTPGDFTIGAGSLDAHAQFSVSAGEIYDEDLAHDITASTVAETKEIYYTDGSGNTRWVDAEATFPVYAIGGVIAYNNAGTLTAVANNKYICYHVFATNIKTDANGDYPVIMVPGNTEYANKTAARDGASSEIATLTTGDWPMDETVQVATVIYQHLAAMGNGVEAAIVTVNVAGDEFIDWRSTQAQGAPASATDHGVLSGLSDDDHPQYLLADGTRALTANWDVGAFDIRAADLTADDGGVFTDTITELTGSAGVTIADVLKASSNIEAAANIQLENTQHLDVGLNPFGYVTAVMADASNNILIGSSGRVLSLDGTTVKIPYGPLQVDQIDEYTGAAGVTIDGVLMKGGAVSIAAVLQLPYLGAAPAALANGMAWMESDGLHIYYAGAEKVVAGV